VTDIDLLNRPRIAPLLLAAILLGSSSFAACGTSATGTKAVHHRKVVDSNDPDGNDPYSVDDYVYLDYGEAASAPVKREVTKLVKRYYAAAAADDGTKACSLIVEHLAEVVPGSYGHAPGPPYLNSQTCALIARVFKRLHRELATEAATLQVTRVRVNGERGLVILHFATISEPRQLAIRREGHTWKIWQLLDTGMT